MKQYFLYHAENFLWELFSTQKIFHLGNQTVLQNQTDVFESL